MSQPATSQESSKKKKGSGSVSSFSPPPPLIVIPSNGISLTHMPSFLSAAECDEIIALQKTYAQSPLYHNGVRSHWVLQIPTQPTLPVPSILTELQDRMLSSSCFSPIRHKLKSKNAWLIEYPMNTHATAHVDGAQAFTCLVYLNSVTAGKGGETHFTKLEIKFQPQQGDAIMWRTLSPEDGVTNMIQSEHEGLPCDEVKFVLNCGFEFE